MIKRNGKKTESGRNWEENQYRSDERDLSAVEDLTASHFDVEHFSRVDCFKVLQFVHSQDGIRAAIKGGKSFCRFII